MSNDGFKRGGFKRNGRSLSLRGARGFTLIEVMIAVLILGFGLLGLAMLQTMSVRFAQSANYRTQATNLAYDMLDQMRVNRRTAAAYAGNYAASTANCAPGATVNPTEFRGVWECRLNYALGAGATATVAYAADGTGGNATVDVTWGDERWQVNVADRDQTFQVTTRL